MATQRTSTNLFEAFDSNDFFNNPGSLIQQSMQEMSSMFGAPLGMTDASGMLGLGNGVRSKSRTALESGGPSTGLLRPMQEMSLAQRPKQNQIVFPTFDVKGVDPANIQITVNEKQRAVSVKGEQEVQKDNGHGGVAKSQSSFSYSFTLPEGADPNSVVSSLDKRSGQLKLDYKMKPEVKKAIEDQKIVEIDTCSESSRLSDATAKTSASRNSACSTARSTAHSAAPSTTRGSVHSTTASTVRSAAPSTARSAVHSTAASTAHTNKSTSRAFYQPPKKVTLPIKRTESLRINEEKRAAERKQAALESAARLEKRRAEQTSTATRVAKSEVQNVSIHASTSAGSVKTEDKTAKTLTKKIVPAKAPVADSKPASGESQVRVENHLSQATKALGVAGLLPVMISVIESPDSQVALATPETFKTFDVTGFDSENINVSIDDTERKVFVSGTQEAQEQGDQGTPVTSMKSFSYNFVLPEEADAASVESTLENGKLKVEYKLSDGEHSSRMGNVSQSSETVLTRVSTGTGGLNVIEEEITRERINIV